LQRSAKVSFIPFLGKAFPLCLLCLSRIGKPEPFACQARRLADDCFTASRRDDLVVSWETERNWYRHFTKIDLDTAQEYNQRATEMMSCYAGIIGGRAFNPLEES